MASGLQGFPRVGNLVAINTATPAHCQISKPNTAGSGPFPPRMARLRPSHASLPPPGWVGAGLCAHPLHGWIRARLPLPPPCLSSPRTDWVPCVQPTVSKAYVSFDHILRRDMQTEVGKATFSFNKAENTTQALNPCPLLAHPCRSCSSTVWSLRCISHCKTGCLILEKVFLTDSPAQPDLFRQR